MIPMDRRLNIVILMDNVNVGMDTLEPNVMFVLTVKFVDFVSKKSCPN